MDGCKLVTYAHMHTFQPHTAGMYVYIHHVCKHSLKERQAKNASVGLLRLGNPIQQQLLDLQQLVTSPTFLQRGCISWTSSGHGQVCFVGPNFQHCAEIMCPAYFLCWRLLIEPVIQEMDLRMAAEGAANRSPDPRFNQPHTEDWQCDVEMNGIGEWQQHWGVDGTIA